VHISSSPSRSDAAASGCLTSSSRAIAVNAAGHAVRADRALRRRLDVERSATSNRGSRSPASSPRRT
jgi:hypothetical protein